MSFLDVVLVPVVAVLNRVDDERAQLIRAMGNMRAGDALLQDLRMRIIRSGLKEVLVEELSQEDGMPEDVAKYLVAAVLCARRYRRCIQFNGGFLFWIEGDPFADVKDESSRLRIYELIRYAARRGEISANFADGVLLGFSMEIY